MASKADMLADALDDILGENSEQLGVQGFLDTGIPELNYIMSGSHSKGVPYGRMIEIFGPSSSGKSFLSTMMMAAAQKAGGIAGFSDHERSFEPNLAASIGLDLSKSKFRYLRPKTFEESIALAMKFCEAVRDRNLIPFEAPLIWVFDSVAAMVPHSKMYDDKGNRRDVGDYNMRDKLALASSCSQSYPALAQFAEDYNMTVLLLNQIRVKPGVLYGDPTTTPGGNAAEFYASTRLSLGKKDITIKEGGEKKTIGFSVTAKTVKNKVARPLQTASWQIRFNEGLGVTIDRVASVLDYCVRKGFVEKTGTRVEWEGKKLYQSQLETLLKADSKGIDKLLALIPNIEED